MQRNSPVAIAVALVVTGATATFADPAPHQFIAKTYTEALGRLPDSTGYGLAVNEFRRSGCSVASLVRWARQFYDSPMHPQLTEYASAYPKGPGSTAADTLARILTLYRGVLNREPSAAELDARRMQYRSGPWSAVLEDVLGGAEFQVLADRICARDFYGFGDPAHPALDLPFEAPAFEVLGCTAECHAAGTCRSDVADAAALQSALNCASLRTGPGGQAVVELAPQAVFRLYGTLVVPGNVTLRTRAPAGGWPWLPAQRYALMARLVRATNFGGPSVLMPRTTFAGIAVGRAAIHHVWVEGHRGQVEPGYGEVNVSVSGGNGAEVFGCRINHTAGWTNVLVNGMTGGSACAEVRVRRNLITEYTSCHSRPEGPVIWADGISSSCENTLIEENQLADVTDVAIVVFRGTEATAQRSIVRRNQVLGAGNAAWAALVADPLYDAVPRTIDFTGTRFEANRVWSGEGHFDVGLLVGTAAIPWGPPANLGRGAAFVDNVIGWPAPACSARVDVGIAVSGMLDAVVTGNRLALRLADVGPCPKAVPECGAPNPAPGSAAVIAARCSGRASGTIEGALDLDLWRCLGHSPQPDCGLGLNAGSEPTRWPAWHHKAPQPLPARRDLAIEAVFPNPTRGAFVVRYSSVSAEPVRVELLDAAGRRIATRVAAGGGDHALVLGEGERVPPGRYLVKLVRGDAVEARPIVVLE